MGQVISYPREIPLVNATVTATGQFFGPQSSISPVNGALYFSMPIADSYTLIADASSVSGTTPTYDISLQHSPDGGISWYPWVRFAQITAASQRQLSFAALLSISQAAAETAIGTTGALAQNLPVSLKYCRLNVLVGGTTPSAVLKVFLIAAQLGQKID